MLVTWTMRGSGFKRLKRVASPHVSENLKGRPPNSVDAPRLIVDVDLSRSVGRAFIIVQPDSFCLLPHTLEDDLLEYRRLRLCC